MFRWCAGVVFVNSASCKVIILQRVIPHYRVAVFRNITTNKEFDISLVIGQDTPKSKAKNAADLTGIKYQQLSTSFIDVKGRRLAHHHGLLQTLKNEQPDVIICEAESHLLGYLTAIFYKFVFSRNTKLILWCFFALPGVLKEKSYFHSCFKMIARKCFDGFLSYGTFGRQFLESQGYDRDRISVAVNVCDTAAFLKLDHELYLSKNDAKSKLGVDKKFVVTYVGTLDEVKKPDLILKISQRLCSDSFQFFIVGSGNMNVELTNLAADLELKNVTFTGRLGVELPIYYRASDLIIVPGRGGIVISEAMCFGVPVLVHQADGVEHDLVISEASGKILKFGTADDFAMQIKSLADCETSLGKMGQTARNLILYKYNTETMAQAIIKSIKRVTT